MYVHLPCKAKMHEIKTRFYFPHSYSRQQDLCESHLKTQLSVDKMQQFTVSM